MIGKIAIGALALLGGLIVLAALLVIRTDIPRAEVVAEYRAPDSVFVTLDDGSEIHMRDAGPKDAPAILLMHGFGSSSYAWDGWTAALSDRYRVLRMDMPGHGLTHLAPGSRFSMANTTELIDATLDKLGVQHVAIGGNSMGGGMAWRYAAQRPDRVSALIVVDSGGGGPPQSARRGGGRFGVVAPLARWVSGSLVWNIALRNGPADASRITPDLVRRADRLWRAEGNRETLFASISGGFGQTADPAAIRAPTLVIAGEKDTLVSPDRAKALADAIPGARFILYPGLGHTPHEEDAAKTAADAGAFLDEVRGEGG